MARPSSRFCTIQLFESCGRINLGDRLTFALSGQRDVSVSLFAVVETPLTRMSGKLMLLATIVSTLGQTDDDLCIGMMKPWEFGAPCCLVKLPHDCRWPDEEQRKGF